MSECQKLNYKASAIKKSNCGRLPQSQACKLTKSGVILTTQLLPPQRRNINSQ